MGQKFSSGYAPVGPQVQMQVIGGSLDGYFLGRYPDDQSYLTAVPPSAATTFILDQNTTDCKHSHFDVFTPDIQRECIKTKLLIRHLFNDEDCPSMLFLKKG